MSSYMYSPGITFPVCSAWGAHQGVTPLSSGAHITPGIGAARIVFIVFMDYRKQS